jgi:NAD(P)-dependent dehydrogenase (short-subunit alcohol dehydrogenase family)
MPEELFSVSGQVVLVSGGSRGIGRAIAEGFARRGARVIITGRNQAILDEAAAAINVTGAQVKSLVCDVAQPAAIDRLENQVMRDHGRIDTLINSAGVNRRKAAATVTEEDYDYIVDINLKGAFQLSQAIGRHMIQQRSGSQINIASLATDRPLKHAGPYAISKAGLGQMTRSLAMEWGPHGVRVNAIAPGFIITDLTRKIWADEKLQAWGIANTPQRRLGQPQDLVGVALFLASPAAAFLTGQIIYVDGGFSAGWAWPLPE